MRIEQGRSGVHRHEGCVLGCHFLIGDASCLILILDLRMPGMDGLELQRHLANANHRVPIIFISARANEGDRKQAIEKGAVDFLYKPFSEDALFKAIQLALSRPQDSK